MLSSNSSQPSSPPAIPDRWPEVMLFPTVFNYFDRDSTLDCANSLLGEPGSAALLESLISSATIKMTHDEWSAERRANCTSVSHLVPLSRLQQHLPPLDCPYQADGANFSNQSGQIELLNLRKLHELLPSGRGRGDYEQAFVSFNWQVFMMGVFSLTAIISFTLNTVSTTVIIRSKKRRLGLFMLNLSLSDMLLTCISTPYTYTEHMLGTWRFFDFLCPASHFMIMQSMCVSIATMTIIGFYRYAAMVDKLHPVKIGHWRPRRIHLVLGIWLLGIAVMSPFYFMYETKPFCYNKRLYFQCCVAWQERTSNLYAVVVNFFTLVGPLLIFSSLHIRVGLKLKRSLMPGNGTSTTSSAVQMQRKNAARKLLIYVTLYLVSWLPIHIYFVVTFVRRLFEKYGGSSAGNNIVSVIFYFIYWTSMAHSCINPIIYYFMDSDFRHDLRDLLDKCASSQSDQRDSGIHSGLESPICEGGRTVKMGPAEVQTLPPGHAMVNMAPVVVIAVERDRRASG